MNAEPPLPTRPKLTVAALVEKTRDFLHLRYLAGEKGSERTISQPRVQKPGLALAGFLEYLHRGRVQILGNSEITYLKQMEPAQRRLGLRVGIGELVGASAI